MTNEQLCDLALAAIDPRSSADARVVLADAIELAGWKHSEQRAVQLHNLMFGPGITSWGGGSTRVPEWFDLCFKVAAEASSAGNRFIRAIAAVLLFGSWPTSWPLAERCRRKLGYVFPVFPTPSLHDVVEQCIPCPEGQLQRISTANDGLFNDDVLIRVERWPDGDQRIGARCFTVETRITHAAIARSNDVAGILLHECRRLDRALRDEADKVRRT